jgi:cytochrome c oxidase subunit 2
MTATLRLRQHFSAALTAAFALALTGCTAKEYPNSIFEGHTEFNREVLSLWHSLFFWAAIVFVIVEVGLVWVIWRYRRREGHPAPTHVHGNTTLEITWTAIPAVILVFIAVPTVRAIFNTQAKAVPNALQVEVIGHQWWWEFRYPEYGVVTANELYLPIGRTVNFKLTTADVLHSFWIPRLGGKRDLISNHVNYLWFTPDSVDANAWNGSCNEYCGESHANMRFRAFTVTPAEFEGWVAHMKSPAVYGATPAAPVPALPPAPGVKGTAATTTSATVPTTAPATGATTPQAAPVTQASYTGYPADKLPAYAVANAPVPSDLTWPGGLTGDPARGQQIYSRSACIGCHLIAGNPMSVGVIGPNLTHVGSRLTIAAGVYPNDAPHLARWIKNSRAMKPGVLMPTLGKGQYDPILKTVITSGLTDQEIADIVAYLQALK